MAKKKKNPRNSRSFQVAQYLSAILDEPGDDAKNPAEIRIEQAKYLLNHWESAQSSVFGMLWEIMNLKAGYCVRCSEYPCPKCGRDETTKFDFDA